MFYTNTRSPVKRKRALIPTSRSTPTLPPPGIPFAEAVPEGSSSGQLDLCPQCGRRTLLSEPSPQGQLVCLRCGIVSVDLRPGETPEPENAEGL